MKTALIVLLLACSGPASPAHEQASTLTYEAFVSAMRNVNAGDRKGAEDLGIDLKAYNWTWDLSGDSRLEKRVVIVSRMWESEYFLFGPTGRLVVRLKSPGEVRSVQLVDFDADKNPEIVSTQTTDRGTGIRRDEFVIYSISGNRIQELWRRTSFAYSTGAGTVEAETQEEATLRSEDGSFVYEVRGSKGSQKYQRRERFVVTSNGVERAQPN